jgi:hypothetical protein
MAFIVTLLASSELEDFIDIDDLSSRYLVVAKLLEHGRIHKHTKGDTVM